MFAVLVSRRALPTTQALGMLTWSDPIWREMFGGMASRLLWTYMNHPIWSCLRLLRQAADWPRALALFKADPYSGANRFERAFRRGDSVLAGKLHDGRADDRARQGHEKDRSWAAIPVHRTLQDSRTCLAFVKRDPDPLVVIAPLVVAAS